MHVCYSHESRFMKTPERLSALRAAKRTLRVRDQKLSRIKSRLELITAENGVVVEPDVCDEIEIVIDERSTELEKLPSTDFRRIFWDQQVGDGYSAIFVSIKLLCFSL